MRNFGFITSESIVFNGIMQMQYVEAQHVPTVLGGDADKVFIGVISGGNIKFSIEGKQYKVQHNEMFVLHGDVVAENVKCSKAFNGYFMLVAAKYFTTINVDTADFIAAEMLARTILVFELDASYAEQMYNLASHIISVSQNSKIILRDRVSMSLVEAYMYMIISVIGFTSMEFGNMRSNRSLMMMKRFSDLLKDNYLHQRSVDYYASQLGITAKYLSMVCRKHRGLTASRVIDSVIVRHAKMLLKQQGVSVQEVAKLLNFSSQSFFGKYFKQRVGISPSRYKGEE